MTVCFHLHLNTHAIATSRSDAQPSLTTTFLSNTSTNCRGSAELGEVTVMHWKKATVRLITSGVISATKVPLNTPHPRLIAKTFWRVVGCLVNSINNEHISKEVASELCSLHPFAPCFSFSFRFTPKMLLCYIAVRLKTTDSSPQPVKTSPRATMRCTRWWTWQNTLGGTSGGVGYLGTTRAPSLRSTQ